MEFNWEEWEIKATNKTVAVLMQLQQKCIVHDWTIKYGYWSAWYDVTPDNQFLLEGNSLDTSLSDILKQIEDIQADYRKQLAWRVEG